MSSYNVGFHLRAEASLSTLTSDVMKSGAVEGEVLDPEKVRSSIARRLGLDIGCTATVSRDVEGIVEMMLDATQSYVRPLAAERLLAGMQLYFQLEQLWSRLFAERLEAYGECHLREYLAFAKKDEVA